MKVHGTITETASIDINEQEILEIISSRFSELGITSDHYIDYKLGNLMYDYRGRVEKLIRRATEDDVILIKARKLLGC